MKIKDGKKNRILTTMGKKTWNPNWRGISSLKQFYWFFGEMKLNQPVPQVTQRQLGNPANRCTWPGDTPQEKTVLQRVTWPWALGKPRTSWGSELSLFTFLPDGLANTTARSSGKRNFQESEKPISNSKPESLGLKRKVILERWRGGAFTSTLCIWFVN